jgi:hypothetical protein
MMFDRTHASIDQLFPVLPFCFSSWSLFLFPFPIMHSAVEKCKLGSFEKRQRQVYKITNGIDNIHKNSKWQFT